MVGMRPIASSEQDKFLRMAVKHFSEMNPSFVPQDDWKEHYFPTIMANPRYVLRWIVCDEKRAGFILFGLEKHRFLPRTTGVIHEVYVLPEFRRRGVQSGLIAQRLHEAALAGCEYAVVSTNPGSGSQRNMERRGFRLAYTKVVMVREWPDAPAAKENDAHGH